MRNIVSYAFGAFSVVVILGLNSWINKEPIVEKAQVVQKSNSIEIYGGALQVFDVKSPKGKNCVIAVYTPRGIAMHCY